MGILIEQQTVIDCLTTTAKYYDMPQSDEWTKGIHYGLLHGVDNILDNVPTVDAIPKDQYEARLKADMVAMLTEIQLEIEDEAWKQGCASNNDREDEAYKIYYFIQQKIDTLKVESEDKE